VVWAYGRLGAFVGREHELSRLQSALARRVRLALVIGDAGIGKSRFVGEGLSRASVGGMLAVGGGCLPLTGKLPLLPVADILGELSRLDGGASFEAALTAAPPYVRAELARLLPKLSTGETAAAEPAEWQHERLFAALAELLNGVALRRPLALLVEDVHWADGATLDFLTYLVRPSRASAVSLVVTCRSDEVPLDAAVANWLIHTRRDAGVEEIWLGPLSRSEAAEQVSALVGAPVPAGLVEEVYARAEGHPFFTEQLVAAAVTDAAAQRQPVRLPARLAELLVIRAARCGADARAVLSALAVAGRPLTEGFLGQITELDPPTVRAAVHELAVARLLAAPDEKVPRLRHALLGEAVAADLLPSERTSLHERLASALETAGGETLAAEAAGHWAAAGRTVEEMQARLAAASAAEQVSAYADAAAHWQRAIELLEAKPDADLGEGLDLPHVYLRAVDALNVSGDGVQAGAVAEEAYRRFAHHPDRATAALVHLRAACFRAIDSPAAGLPLMKEALRLFEGGPPSADHAKAWYRYANDFLLHGEGRHPEEILAALNSALGLAEGAGAAELVPRILCLIAYQSFLRGEVDEGFGLLARGWSVPEASSDAWTVTWLFESESDALLKVAKLKEATRVGLRGVDALTHLGFESSFDGAVILGNAVEGLLCRGRTAEAAALIDPATAGRVDRDHWPLHACRAEVDLLRGEVDAAVERLHLIEFSASLDFAREMGQALAEAAVWAGRPYEALEEVRPVLERLKGTDWVIFCGWLLAVGMRACGDLAEVARARRGDQAVRSALAAADNLVSWTNQERGRPFTDHPFVGIIPAARATWDAERSRATGANDPAAWRVAASEWEALDYRHRAGYCWWRLAEAQLAAGETPASASAAMRTASATADGHAPLLAQIRALARRARIPLDTSPITAPQEQVPQVSTPYGLTERELEILRLLTHGRSNAEIGAELFISPRTAGVHVTNILRKLGVTNRVQAAALAERAGLFEAGQAGGPLARS
jgi:DNA-binding CsgD family transcriptional regulator